MSPQYHVVYDDLFQTVFSAGQSTSLVDTICEELFTTSCEVYDTDEYDAEDNLVYCPHHWMKSGWMMKVADKVEMSYAVRKLEMMLKFEIERGLQGRK